MSATSTIEWTDRTWNPTRGCSIVSPGCVNCYAMKQAHRFSGPGRPYEGLTKLTAAGPQWTGEVRPVESALLEPLSWKKPARVFVDSMSDLFHQDVPDEFIDRVFAVMALAERHTFQVLTKRAERMRDYVTRLDRDMRFPTSSSAFNGWRCEAEQILEAKGDHESMVTAAWPLPNVWLGVSAENQEQANLRIPLLLQTPAAVRFVSAEPLLGPINFRNFFYSFEVRNPGACAACGNGHGFTRCSNHGSVAKTHRRGHGGPVVCQQFKRHVGREGIDWVIVGGESQAGARPFDINWARDSIRYCDEAGVACFVKQLGALPYEYVDGTSYWRGDLRAFRNSLRVLDAITKSQDGRVVNTIAVRQIHDKKGGDMAEWPADLRVRQFPERLLR